MLDLTGPGKSLTLDYIKEIFQKTGSLQIGKHVDSINNWKVSLTSFLKNIIRSQSSRRYVETICLRKMSSLGN